MIRTKHNKPDAILCSDLHLREDTPVCYIGDFQKEQWDCLDFISDLQKKYDCPVLHAGDLFDHWKPSPFLLSQTIEHLPLDFWTVYGQHDLPQHNLELSNKCGIFTLYKANKLHILPQGHWGKKEVTLTSSWIIKNKNIYVWHTFNYQSKQPWPDCPSPTASKLLKKYTQYDLIVTGDNHMPFVEEYEGRLLVNPGSMTRQKVDQINHKPRVYLWYAETNTVKSVYLPIEPGEDVISREHLEIMEQRNERIDAFVSNLDTDWESTMSFEENLKQFENINQVQRSVMGIVYKSLEI